MLKILHFVVSGFRRLGHVPGLAAAPVGRCVSAVARLPRLSTASVVERLVVRAFVADFGCPGAGLGHRPGHEFGVGQPPQGVHLRPHAASLQHGRHADVQFVVVRRF